MRLWSLKRGQPFKCHLAENCSGGLFGKEIENDGENRFSCFRCDYNLCRPCYEGNLEYERLENEEMTAEALAAALATGSDSALATAPPSAHSFASSGGGGGVGGLPPPSASASRKSSKADEILFVFDSSMEKTAAKDV